jgi:hypothetical protein
LGDVAEQQDLDEEQQYLDRAYQGVEAMRGEATRMLDSVLDLGRGGTFQSRTERDIVVRTSLARLAQLDIGDEALCFGRIDRAPTDGELGESFHIGRLAVSGPDHEPLVVDWRAPVAEPFYRATGLDPQGLSRRRHLAVRDRRVVGVEDELFGAAAQRPGAERAGAPAGLADDGLILGGPGALLAALDEARTGRMSDIVGTIQREQDEIIRSPLAGVLVVQGGPGTGKTAVALHRAAYLLYTHRFPLERQGVLVIGPNPLFLRYIEQVLPSLGETGVTLSTVTGLVPEIRVRGVDRTDVARLKGEARMARVISRAIRTRQRPLRQDVDVPFGAVVLRLGVAASERIIDQARRRPGPHNLRRRFVEDQVLALLVEQDTARRAGLETPVGRPETPAAASDLSGAGDPHEGVESNGSRPADDLEGPLEAVDAESVDAVELTRRLRRAPAVIEALDRMWPRLSGHELLHDLLGARPLLAAAGKGVLSAAEQALLFRPRSASLDEVPFTTADAALVDEARALLGPRRARRGRSRPDTRERTERVREEAGFWPRGLDPSPLPAGGTSPWTTEFEEVRAYGLAARSRGR